MVIDQPAWKSLEAASDHRIEWSQVRSRSPLLLLASLASTVVAAEMADYKRGLEAIVTKVQANGDASGPVNADTVTALGHKASYLSVRSCDLYFTAPACTQSCVVNTDTGDSLTFQSLDVCPRHTVS